MRAIIGDLALLSIRTLAALGATSWLVFGIGCSSKTGNDSHVDETTTESPAKIAWYDGDVDDAFEYARSAGKPLFLYWGAEWCPPCHYLKNKIFSRPEFVAQIENFVPIYLDGDTEQAQVLGETLDVQGYPTVIIFNPMGDEVMRMSSSVPVDQYAAVLDNAVADTRPIQEVLVSALDQGPGSAPDADLTMLANYSWSQASNIDLSDEELQQAFKRLFEETPEHFSVARSRFLAFYIQSLLAGQADESDTPSTVDSNQYRALIPAIEEMLADDQTRRSNVIFIGYGVDSKIALLAADESPQRAGLIAAWQSAAHSIESNDSLTVDDRLAGTLALVDLDRIMVPASDSAETGPASAEIQEHVRQQVSWALEAVHDGSELQSVVNTLAHILESAGMEDEAETLLVETMDETTAPYYFMDWVAELKERGGDSDAAIAWYRKAYDNSRGRYSRFRYGSTYLRKLMDLQPQAADIIENDSLEILGELLSHDDAFAGGNYSRLNSLESTYGEWNDNGEHDASLTKIRAFVQASCERYPEGSQDGQHQRCIEFLSPERSTEMMM